MSILLENINWLAVAISAVLAFMLGWAWYSPRLFGDKWAQGVGLSLQTAEPSMMALLAQALGTLSLAWLVGILWVNAGLVVIFLLMLTFVLLIGAAGFFAQKSHYAIATEASFMVAMMVVMIVVQLLL